MTAVSEQFLLFEPARLSRLRCAQSIAEENVVVTGIAHIENAAKGALSFCDRPPEKPLDAPGATILVPLRLAADLKRHFPSSQVLAVEDARATFIDIVEALLADRAIQPTDAVPRPFGVHSSARVGAHCYVDPEAFIEQDVVIGPNCAINRGSWIKAGAIIRENSVIGGIGINAYVGHDGKRRRFPHLGGTVVGRGSEIGAGSVVVRGILSSTWIGDGCTIGNLCNVGHGVEIGDDVWMSVGTLIGGHAKIGERASLGMSAVVRDNVTIGARGQVGMGSVVVDDVSEGSSVFGNPARTMPALRAGPHGYR